MTAERAARQDKTLMIANLPAGSVWFSAVARGTSADPMLLGTWWCCRPSSASHREGSVGDGVCPWDRVTTPGECVPDDQRAADRRDDDVHDQQQTAIVHDASPVIRAGLQEHTTAALASDDLAAAVAAGRGLPLADVVAEWVAVDARPPLMA